MKAGPAQLVHRQRQNGHGDTVGVQGIRLAHAPALLGIHPRGLGDRESVGSHGAGEDRPVGRSAFDDPEVSASALVRRATHLMARLIPDAVVGNDCVSSSAPLVASRMA